MKGRQIVLGPLFGRDAAALVVDGQLEDLAMAAQDSMPLPPGAICRAKVDRLVKGQGGVFLRLPGGLSGYLRDRSGLREGQVLTVQVTGAAEEGKAIPVSSRLLLRGRYVIVTPGAPGVNVSRRIRDTDLRDRFEAMGHAALHGMETPPGLIFRSIAADSETDDIRGELDSLLAIATAITAEGESTLELLLDAPTPSEIAWCDWGDPTPDSVLEGVDAMADCGVDAAVEALLSERVDLGQQAWAAIETTRALTAIDVNTGSDNSPAAGLKANIALARELPRQLRLRGIGGQIVVDFAPMAKKDRGTLEQILRASFKREAAETVLIGWTAMGLFEINRKRDRIPLLQQIEG